MRRLLAAVTGAVLAVAAVAAPSGAAIKGHYVEVRSADVYTGPCFANSQVGLEGNQAILAWTVDEGSWHGVKLNGLGVLAVVQASATLGDPYHNPYPAKAVLIVDQRATAPERAALEAMAKAQAGELLRHVVAVESAPISIEIGQGAEHGTVKLAAGNLARIETRSLCSKDDLCGNEEVYYPPLVKLTEAMPAFTVEEAFSGKGLNAAWDRVDRRSAFVGRFTL